MSFAIGFVIFPNLTQLDFTGPLQVLQHLPDATTHIVAKTRDLVRSDGALAIPPTATFADCPGSISCVCPAALAWTRRWKTERRSSSYAARAPE